MTKQTKIDEISLFLPVYNEQEVIKQTIQDSQKVIKKIAKKYEILVINDGSSDKTPEIVKGLIKKNKNIRMITHNPNKGYGGAIKTGLKESKYKNVSFIDSDGQFKFKEITKFMPHIGRYDLIIGYRIVRNDPIHRKMNALLWKVWMWLLFGLWVKDTDCGFKVIKRDVCQKITCTTESAITEAEFLIRAKQAGFTFKEVGVHHYPRAGGKSTGANLKVILRALTQSFALWYQLNFAD
jgi:glycosyltransferase involved in cell wall biosynthesis